MFKLIDQIVIKNTELNIKPDNDCYLYKIKESGLSTKEFTNFFNDKVMDIYEFTGRFSTSKKCPWCENQFNNLEEHISEHNKSLSDVNTNKLSARAYTLLLSYLRTDNYDTLAFYLHLQCQYCIAPISPDRKGKCEIPSSTRNRMRSLKILGFKCEGFDINNYPLMSVAYIYKRRPMKGEIN